MGWQDVRFIVDGEPVTAAVSGRPDRSLSARTQFLKDRLDATEAGRAIVLEGVPVAADVTVKKPVYYDVAAGEYRLARWAVTTDAAGRLVAAESSLVAGVVLRKNSPRSADLILWGAADMTGFVAGAYGLSGTTPGGLELRAPGNGVHVLTADGAGTVIVAPSPPTSAFDHVHYRFDLFTDRADDASTAGWLAADDASFAGAAPPGAKFGYNVPLDAALAASWPPIPPSAAGLTLFSSAAAGFGLEVALGEGGLAVIDANGIWWMSDCYGQTPWDLYAPFTSLPDGVLPSGASADGCPSPAFRKLVLYFAKSLLATGNTVVTRLIAADPAGPIFVRGCGGEAAEAGALEVGIDFDSSSATEDEIGSLAVKGFTGTRPRLGRMIEGLKTSSPAVTLTGTTTRLQGTETVHQGIVDIEVAVESRDRILAPQLARLIKARDRYENGVPTYGLPETIESAIVFVYELPSASGFFSQPAVVFRLWLTGEVAGTLPDLAVTYKMIPPPSGATLLAVATDGTMTIDTTETLTATGQYAAASSDPVTGLAESLFLVTVTRAAGDGYPGEVGVLKASLLASAE